MLNDDGVVAPEFDVRFFSPSFVEILNSHTGMANHIAWDLLVYRENSLPVAKSRILNRMSDNLWIVMTLEDYRLFWWVAIGILWIGNQTAMIRLEISTEGQESHSTEAKFSATTGTLRMESKNCIIFSPRIISWSVYARKRHI